MDADSSIVAGQRFAERYFVYNMIGTGGFGTVWHVRDEVEERDVVLKVMHGHFMDHRTMKERFRSEAKALARLAHPSIVRLLDAFPENDPPYMVMELIEGRVLHHEMATRCSKGTGFGLDEILRIAEHLIGSLTAAHDAEIVHRDLKPSNIMLVEGEAVVKVLDFGIAKLLDADFFAATTLGRRVGTITYWAPEQALGHAVGPGADQFALATILFELLTLRRPWVRDGEGQPPKFSSRILRASNGPIEVLKRMVTGGRPDVRRYRPQLSAEVDRVLSQAWATKAADRFPTIGAFGSAFSAALGAQVDGEDSHPTQHQRAFSIWRLPMGPEDVVSPTSTREVPSTLVVDEPFRARLRWRNTAFFVLGMALILGGYALGLYVADLTPR